MNNNMKCDRCNTEMKVGEGWIEFNEETRHAEYYLCPKCDSLYNLLGDLVIGSVKEFQLTFVHQ